MNAPASPEPLQAPQEAQPARLRVVAPAKINLYLGVHDQTDERGYHRVDSVMATTTLADYVTIEPAGQLAVYTVPAADFPMEHNTAYRAAEALGGAVGRTPAFTITIEKHIPLRAGLGGPSADAAAVLYGLCRAWGIDPHDERVDRIARGIGADVPFFLYGPLAYCDGAGDRFNEGFEPFAGMPLVLVKPPQAGVTAAEAYRRFDEQPPALPPLEPLLAALRAHDAAAVPTRIANNLAPAACAIAPEIADVVAWLQAQDGVLAAQVTGSGACSFALCASYEVAERLAQQASCEHGWWSSAATMENSGVSFQTC